MLRRLSLLFAGLLLASTSAQGVEMLESSFQVSYRYGGKDHVEQGNVVPLLPGNSCYYWYIRAAEANAPVKAVERFTLPEPLADWGSTGSTPEDPTQIEQDGRVAVTTLERTTDADGWFSNGWCAARGDPLGTHRIEVSVDGAPVATFDFEVVAPRDYDFPVAPSREPTVRSSGNSR